MGGRPPSGYREMPGTFVDLYCFTGGQILLSHNSVSFLQSQLPKEPAPSQPVTLPAVLECDDLRPHVAVEDSYLPIHCPAVGQVMGPQVTNWPEGGAWCPRSGAESFDSVDTLVGDGPCSPVPTPGCRQDVRRALR